MTNHKHTRFSISGMNCGHCVAAVREALEQLEGVQVQDVSIGSATVTFDPERVSIGQLTDAIDDAGYAATAGAAE